MACAEEALATLRPTTGTLVCVPVAHPAALVAGTRRGPDGLDLNRTYPGRPDGSPTEQAADRLWTRMREAAPAALVTLHSWSRSGSAHPHVEHARSDERGRELAHLLGLPFVLPFDWPDGLLPRIAVEHGIPSVELELGGLGAQTPGSLARGLRAIESAAAWLGMLEPAAAPALAPAPGGRSAERIAAVAGAEGRVRQLVPLGRRVEPGDPLCEIRSHDGAVVDRVASPAGGWMGVHVTYGYAAPGDDVAMVFAPAEATA
jgi:predicted deacylase